VTQLERDNPVENASVVRERVEPNWFDEAALAEHLSRSGLVPSAEVQVARAVARSNGSTLCKSLLDLGLLSEEGLADAVSERFAVARWSPDDEEGVLAEEAPPAFMRASGALLLREGDGGLRAVVSDPSDRHTWQALLSQGGEGGGLASLRLATQKQVLAWLDRERELESADDRPGGVESESLDVSGELSALRELASEAPVVRFFNQTIERAMELGASDVHIERYDRRTSLRYRVDGVLIEQPPPPASMHDALLCRVKIMGGLDIAERRRAQDGRVKLRLRGRAVDMRVSLVPTMYGQDAAIRLQDRQRLAEITPEDLGFEERHLDRLRAVARKSHGILLITGPTGSGKTTTLYSLLRELASTDRKVVTVEDPVEYAMDGVNQIQVNATVGLTFDTTLRHVLRHDPDVILVGEIRDRETAEMAFQSALTGHMVLSTLHTNDVPSSYVRLTDMGVEPYLVNAAVEGVSAQRLLRRVCSGCGNDAARRESCGTCKGLGYRGRVAVMEFARTTAQLKRAMLAGADERHLREALDAAGFESMRGHAERLAERGVTDRAEITRVLGLGHAGDAEA
jgi:general secretion pathway protein E